ncbi:DUF2306 domain-containing protein [Pseudonocardia sp. KRD-184]|uniref:DUF2306 domain-containing protein n=1 Tax=Pseudonocardia oceani TaxID=2792013 RepID=A0ABS6UKW3_9PSEU|nr:DUF2306 domain-containing protein [Pseudonocardia oceani]MBW0098903.1 DUF2306 domain-containing protein [Pseudonocardia oceani]MBW0108130.1 DUF2306 domain-containing protein [Pseudonocardia oceani]MBW0124809.1 DUF2306 domain-containing protein [Pseudonocardia oceani]MBW0132538.1 DUF2306 domain-containing protein [Pseudonocardia oceani]
MPLDVTIAVHVGCGVVAVACGPGAMLTRKGSRRHRGFGRIYLGALLGLGLTAPVLAAVDWAHRWHLAVLGGLALGAATAGAAAVRLLRPIRLAVHITGMGTAYVVMLTAFYVDNGPRLPLWDQLPPIVFWVLPAAVGTPVLLGALHRHRGGRPPARPT